MLSTRTTRRLVILGAALAVAAALTALVGCDLGGSGPVANVSGETGTVTMKIVKSEAVAEAIPASTVRVDVTMSAGDFSPITRTATFTAGDTEATVTFEDVQVGSNRLVSVVARDQNVATQHAVAVGTALVDVYPGTNALTTITLAPTPALAESVLALPTSGFSTPSLVVNPDPNDPSLGVATLSPLLAWNGSQYVAYTDSLTAANISVIENNDSVRTPTSVSRGGTAVDLVFVMDVSASMQEERDGVVASIEAFLDSAPTHDFQLGCVSFRYDDAAPDGYLDFVDDDAAGIQTFKDFVGGLTIESVGSRAENGAMGVLYAHNHFTWRPEASRAYILITDEPIQAGTSGDDIAACVAALAGNSVVHVVSPARFSVRPDDPKLIADGTGGTWYDLPTSGAFSLTDLGIVSAFVNYYSITYPTTLLGTEKSVTVVVNCPQGVARDTCSANWSAPWDELGGGGLPGEIYNPKDPTMRLVLVPAGPAIFGADDSPHSNERPQFTATLPAYYLGETEVTNAQYAAFLNDVAPSDTDLNTWIEIRTDGWMEIQKSGNTYTVVPGRENRPVVFVSWYGATAYCDWAGLRLPSELEWEKGARGTDGREYPWGGSGYLDGWDATLCRNWTNQPGYPPAGTCEATDYPGGQSPYGLYSMAGNVWEWTADWYSGSVYIQYEGGDLTPPASGSSRVPRGGGWYGDNDFRCADRGTNAPDYRSLNGGFRCAASP